LQILSIVSAKEIPHFPVSGVWSTHHRQTFMKLILSPDGQATIITIRTGSHSVDIYDYHLVDQAIVIETRCGPLTLRRDGKIQKSGPDGIARHYLIADPTPMLRGEFPGATIRFSPVSRSSESVSRPSALYGSGLNFESK
jgi:hypothetical protein